jgi:hypothetical protein
MATKRERDQLKRMYRRQGGLCHWCEKGMVPPGTAKPGGPHDPRLCTMDHLDDRFSEERGTHPGEYRKVAACWKCNNERGQRRQAAMPIAVLHERSKRQPSGATPTKPETEVKG